LLFVSRLPRPPSSTLLPYTTLFRSAQQMRLQGEQALCTLRRDLLVLGVDGELLRRRTGVDHGIDLRGDRAVDDHELMVHQHVPRSEEHTSELQSRFDLVCRLLLEKK